MQLHELQASEPNPILMAKSLQGVGQQNRPEPELIPDDLHSGCVLGCCGRAQLLEVSVAVLLNVFKYIIRNLKKKRF